MQYTIGKDINLSATEVSQLRIDSGWDGDVEEWEACLRQNLLNVSARTADGRIVGVGFLCGSVRHAEVVDLVVLPEFQKQGIGGQILDYIINYAESQNIKYFGLTYDKNFPWLKDFYEKHGFKAIDFAMWHKDSLK